MIYYEDTQTEKSPLVLVAGLATDALSWVFQTGPLSQNFRLITCDNRGVGRSEISAGPYTIEQMSNDLLEVLDHLQLPKVSLLGHSMGGAIVQHFAMTHPHRVEKVVLASTFPRAEEHLLRVLESWVDILKLEGSIEQVARVLLPWLYTRPFFAETANFEGSVAAMAAHPYPMNPVGVQAQLEALKAFDSTAELGRLQAQTLVLGGALDILVPPDIARSLAEALPHAQLHLLPGAGHSCMLEKPDLFNSAVLEFLG